MKRVSVIFSVVFSKCTKEKSYEIRNMKIKYDTFPLNCILFKLIVSKAIRS